MVSRLERANDEVDRIGQKITMMKEQLKAAEERRRLIENEETVAAIRKLGLGREALVGLLARLQAGELALNEKGELAIREGDGKESPLLPLEAGGTGIPAGQGDAGQGKETTETGTESGGRHGTKRQ